MNGTGRDAVNDPDEPRYAVVDTDLGPAVEVLVWGRVRMTLDLLRRESIDEVRHAARREVHALAVDVEEHAMDALALARTDLLANEAEFASRVPTGEAAR